MRSSSPSETAVDARVPPAVADLEREIRHAWSAATSATSAWSADRPSVGQCAVTALLVQDYFGGELLRGVVCGESHYWNRLPDGTEVDLTADQFQAYRLEAPAEARGRAYVLSFPDTANRYQRLRASVGGLSHAVASAAPLRG